MPRAHVNGIEIEYVTEGDPSEPALLLVMGLGGQLTAWPEGFVDGLRARGFFLIRFDNRDCGLSTKFEGLPDMTALFTGDPSSAPYRVEDMADDAAALLEDLGIAKTHVVGVSMGGMITQALVVNHPELFLTASSIMSTTGDRSVGAPTGEAMTALLRPMATSRDEAIEASLAGSRVIGSPAYPTDDALLRGGPPRHTTAPTAPRARSASSPPSSPHPTGPRGSEACGSRSSWCTVRQTRSSP